MPNRLRTIIDPLEAFVQYFLDTKPYHTKILEIIETYQFNEELEARIKEEVWKHITMENDPLCKMTGFGLDYDDECGYDAIDCCNLFDCYDGGYGFIFDNSDLLVDLPIDVINYDEGSEDGVYVGVEGNYTVDTRLPIISIPSTNQFVVAGDQTTLFNTHNIFLNVNVAQVEIESSSLDEVTLDGNWYDLLSPRNVFYIVGTNTEHNARYNFHDVEYDSINNKTIIKLSEELTDSLAGLFLSVRNTNPNIGIYQPLNVVYDNGTDTTTVTVTTENEFLKDESELDPDQYGSIQLRTGLKFDRLVDIGDPDSTEHYIYYSEYLPPDSTSPDGITRLYLSGDISDYTGDDNVKLFGYFVPAGFDEGRECTNPKSSHVYSTLEEEVALEIDDSLVDPYVLSVRDVEAQYPVCSDIIELSTNVNLFYEADTQYLTFSWTQIDGPPITIINPDTFDATIDVTGESAQNRTFLLSVFEAGEHRLDVEVPILGQIIEFMNTGIRGRPSAVQRGTYDGDVEHSIRLYTDPMMNHTLNCGETKLPGIFTSNRIGKNTTITKQELEQWVSPQWSSIETVYGYGSGNRFEIQKNEMYRIKTTFKNKITNKEYIDYTNTISTSGLNLIDKTIAVAEDNFNNGISPAANSKIYSINRIERSIIIEQIEEDEFSNTISSTNTNQYSLNRVERTQKEEQVGAVDNSFNNSITSNSSNNNNTTQSFDINRSSGKSISR